MGIFSPFFTKNWCHLGCLLALLGLSLLMAVYHNTCISTYHDNEAAQNATNDEVKTQQSYTVRHLGVVTFVGFPSLHTLLGNALR